MTVFYTGRLRLPYAKTASKRSGSVQLAVPEKCAAPLADESNKVARALFGAPRLGNSSRVRWNARRASASLGTILT
jgi:hypothetical protein